MLVFFVIMSLYTLVLSSVTSPEESAAAWRPENRFTGVRYECIGATNPRQLASSIASAADDISGFGWVQVVPVDRVVGEFRGAREAAVAFRAFLQGPEAALAARVGLMGLSCDVQPYGDTLIKFLFPEFRVLDDSRITCFENAPHACAAMHVRVGESSGGDADLSTTTEEDL
jgi:hypothetical protein